MHKAGKEYMLGKTQRRKKLVKHLSWFFIIIAVLGVFKVWQSVAVDELTRTNQKLQKDLKYLEYESAILTAQAEDLLNVNRVETIARERLGFVQAEKINIDLYPDIE